MGGERFEKYARSGAYHWRALSPWPWRRHWYTVARYRATLEAAGIRPGERVLDLGCGDGALLWLASRRGAICTGVDTDDVGLRLAQTKLADRHVEAPLLGDVRKVADGSQDCVLLCEVIEHVPDPVEVLEEARRVLVAGGRIVITTPVRATESPVDPEHGREFYPGELRDLCSSVFEIRDHLLRFPIALLELYESRPRVFVRRPVFAWVINILDAWLRIDVARLMSLPDRYHHLQIILATKACEAE